MKTKRMDPGEVLQKCTYIVSSSSEEAKAHALKAAGFLDYADAIRDIIVSWDSEKIATTSWLLSFSEGLRALRDDYEREVQDDPMIIYKPAHAVALDFHKSNAFIRYFRGGNRISKTESGCADNRWVMTGSHPHRMTAPAPASVFIIGKYFTRYGTNVFQKKYIEGEPGNPLSPVFPENGRWLYHYDPRRFIIKICCRECYEKRRPKDCSHPKSSLSLFSDRDGPMVLAGGQFAQGQFDEHIREDFFNEAIQRLKTVPFANLAVTHTPLEGKGAWEHQKLTKKFEAGAPDNLVVGTSRLYVSLHTIDQLSAGLSSQELVLSDLANMSPAEAEARIFGRPSAFSESSVFDAFAISSMYDEVQTPVKGMVKFNTNKSMQWKDVVNKYGEKTKCEFVPHEAGLLKVWSPPERFAQYIIGADVAKGLVNRDYSSATVLKLTRKGTRLAFEQVAQFHGHINSLSYAEALCKLAIWYNSAVLVVERTGPGDATIHELKLAGYWNLFRDESDASQAMPNVDALFGVDTNVKSKGIMISMLQNAIKSTDTSERLLTVHDYETLEELGSFGQEQTESGLSYRFRGIGGSHDDRVMGLALGIYAASIYPEMYSVELEVRARKANKAQEKRELTDEERQVWADFRRMEAERESDE